MLQPMAQNSADPQDPHPFDQPPSSAFSAPQATTERAPTWRPDRRETGVIRRLGTPSAALPLCLALVYVVLGWHKRWTSDDGFIVFRVVRQLLAGHGPVFNVGERVEPATSTLWTAMLAITAGITRIPLPQLALGLGLLCGAGGIAAAVVGSRRLQPPPETASSAPAGSNTVRVSLPAGILVVLALPPYWDFATAGLEGGLVLGWLGFSWLLLVLALDQPIT